jgi:hypothetical protein
MPRPGVLRVGGTVRGSSRGARQVLLPVTGSRVVRAVRHVLHAAKAYTGTAARLGKRIGFHVDDLAGHRGQAGFKAVAGAADAVRQSRKELIEFEPRRFLLEGRHARREAEARHVHVALHECAAGNHGVRRQHRAARGAEIQHGRQGLAGSTQFCQPARQRNGGIDLAESRVENGHAGCFEDTLCLDFKGDRYQESSHPSRTG